MRKDQSYHQLPLATYTSEEWYAKEQELIFSKVWRLAGFVEDIKDPGDYLTVQAGLNNLFVIMDGQGVIKAFHNICRHRGTQLLRAAGKGAKAITCPYHDWTYNLEGDLIAVPEEKQEFSGSDKKGPDKTGLDKSCLGLKKASIALWRGMIFVHPEPEAPSFADWVAPIVPYLGPHKVEELMEYEEGIIEEEIAANWKVVVENFIDHYHLAHLHSGTLAMYDHKKAVYGFHGPHFAFWEPLSVGYEKGIEKNTPYPLVIPKDNLGAWVFMLFPGIGFVESEISWSSFHVIPLSAGRSRLVIRTRVKNASAWEFQKQEFKSYGYWAGKVRGKCSQSKYTQANYTQSKADKAEMSSDPMTSGDFMAEDIYVCEQQQKSFSSPYFEMGPTAEQGEKPILDHQKVALDYMGQ